MQSRRDFLEILPASLIGAGFSPPASAQTLDQSQTQPHTAQRESSLTLSPATPMYRPLDEISVSGAGAGRLTILDGDGVAYVDRSVTLPASFLAGGALGSHTVLLLDADGRLAGRAGFHLDARTEIREASGEYQHLLDTLYWTMASDG